MMYSVYKLNKQGDNVQPWHTPFLIWNQSVVPYPVLTVASWPAYRFLKRQVRWSGIPISLRIFHSLLWSPQSKTLALRVSQTWLHVRTPSGSSVRTQTRCPRSQTLSHLPKPDKGSSAFDTTCHLASRNVGSSSSLALLRTEWLLWHFPQKPAPCKFSHGLAIGIHFDSVPSLASGHAWWSSG